jgi:hypothetical protein
MAGLVIPLERSVTHSNDVIPGSLNGHAGLVKMTHWMLSLRTFRCRLAPPFPRPFPPNHQGQLCKQGPSVPTGPFPRPDMVSVCIEVDKGSQVWRGMSADGSKEQLWAAHFVSRLLDYRSQRDEWSWKGTRKFEERR